MDRQTATRLIAELLECQKTLDAALVAAEALEDDTERSVIVSTIKNAIGEILTEAIMPIISQHPELNPYA